MAREKIPSNLEQFDKAKLSHITVDEKNNLPTKEGIFIFLEYSVMSKLI